jgi:hypothetical protein
VFHSQEDFFVIAMYVMATEAVSFHSFLSLYIYLFSFFLYSHSKTTGVQLISQRVMTKIKLLLLLLLLGNTFSECLIDNLTSSFHILMQGFVLFFHGRPTDRQLIVSLPFPVLGIAPNKVEFSNLAHTNFVGDSAAMEEQNKPLCKDMKAIGQIVDETF